MMKSDADHDDKRDKYLQKESMLFVTFQKIF